MSLLLLSCEKWYRAGVPLSMQERPRRLQGRYALRSAYSFTAPIVRP